MDSQLSPSFSIQSLSIHGWRNLEKVAIQPHATFNVFYGDNAQGKTNLLEAVYLVGRLKSFREARLSESVRHGSTEAAVQATILRAGITQSVSVAIREGRRNVRVDGKVVQRVSDHCRHYKVVLFTPADIYLPRGAPTERRKFLDRALYNVEPPFLADAQEYLRVLKRRNALLKSVGEHGLDAISASLDAYDEVLAVTGARIACRRFGLVDALQARFGEIWRRVFGGDSSAELIYKSGVPGVAEGKSPEEVAPLFLDKLHATRKRDVGRRATGCGPHLDDMKTLLEGRPIREHGSQGQHRVFVLALKVTEIQLVLERTGVAPVLLLDDISSELDKTRTKQLFDYLAEVRGQVFLTTTSAEHVDLGDESAEYKVEAGSVWRSS